MTYVNVGCYRLTGGHSAIVEVYLYLITPWLALQQTSTNVLLRQLDGRARIRRNAYHSRIPLVVYGNDINLTSLLVYVNQCKVVYIYFILFVLLLRV